MVDQTSHMFVTGPNVIKMVTNEEVSFEDLGGAQTHSSKSGVAHLMAKNDQDCILQIRRLLSFVPQNNLAEAPRKTPSDDAGRRDLAPTIIPDDAKVPYDMSSHPPRGGRRRVLRDPAALRHQHRGRLCTPQRAQHRRGRQPAPALAGVLDIKSSTKAARFVRFCDAFNIPLVTFEDVPGFLPGTEQEWGGIIKHGAKLLFAYCEATVPKITVITRKAYGGAYDVMSSKHIRADYNVAWPSANSR
jgi:acetyl-CoA carboxylase carboxyltransferase component